MKTIWTLLATAVLATAASSSSHAEVRVSMDFFYDNLDPYGTWREVGDYGYCWQPRDVDRDWQPYSDGRWVYTDAGWTWDSDEPYSWAVYHYGRWAFVEDTGWIWVPDTQWGPGWVSWRHSSDYIGWAPLPPEARFIAAVGFSSWVDNYYDIGPRNYRFVETRNFGERRLRARFVDPRLNLAIINTTTNITNITYVNSVVHNGGPRFEEMAGISVHPIQRFRLDRQQQFEGNLRSERGEIFRSREEGNSLRVFAPPVELRATAAPKRLAERVDRVAVNHGWKNAGTEAEMAQLRSQMKSKAQPPAELPPRPRFERPDMRQASEPARQQKQGQSADLPPSSAEKPRATGIPPSLKPNEAVRADQPPLTPIPAKPGNGEREARPKAPDKPPGVPRTEPGPQRIRPVLPADEPNRHAKPFNPNGDTPPQPGSTRVSPPSVRTAPIAPKPDGSPGIPNPVSVAPRVRPQDPPTTLMPDKKPDLPGARERDRKPLHLEETPKSPKPDPTPIPGASLPARPAKPAPAAPDIKQPTPSSPSKKAPPPRDQRPASPPDPMPQRKPGVLPQQPVNKPPMTSPSAPPTEPEQPGAGKAKGKFKDKKKDDPDRN